MKNLFTPLIASIDWSQPLINTEKAAEKIKSSSFSAHAANVTVRVH